MRVAIFDGVGAPLRIAQLPDPVPAADEVVIRVARCGICGTDVHATQGHGWTWPAGTQLGHEYAGEVVAVGRAVTTLRPGDRVAAQPYVGCGTCSYCRVGRAGFCPQRTNYTAGFAEYAAVHARGVTKLPVSLSTSDGALVEPVAVGLHGARLAELKPDSRVLIMGPGPTGLSVLYWARQLGVRRIAMLATSHRRAAIAATMGTEQFVIEGADAASQIEAALGGPPDVVFECVGLAGTLGRAIDLVRALGTVVTLGFCMSPDTIVPLRAHAKEVTLRFSMAWSRAEFERSADALAKDEAGPLAMVSDTIALDDLGTTMEQLRVGSHHCKVMVDPWR